MKDIKVMKFLKPQRNLNERPPDRLLVEHGFLLLVLNDLLVEIAIVGELHDDAACRHPYHSEFDSMKACL